MKKILQNTALILICITALLSFGYISLTFIGGGDVLAPFVGATTAPSTAEITTKEVTTTKAVTTTEKPTTTAPTATTAVEEIEVENFTIIDYFPLSLASGGSWDIKHCQGMAIDQENGYVYYSFTNTFVKCDFEGNAIGSITGIKGHLGDICFNEKDGRIYGSLNLVPCHNRCR